MDNGSLGGNHGSWGISNFNPGGYPSGAGGDWASPSSSGGAVGIGRRERRNTLRRDGASGRDSSSNERVDKLLVGGRRQAGSETPLPPPPSTTPAVFVSPPPPELLCDICNLVFTEPMIVTAGEYAGSTFCRLCIFLPPDHGASGGIDLSTRIPPSALKHVLLLARPKASNVILRHLPISVFVPSYFPDLNRYLDARYSRGSNSEDFKYYSSGDGRKHHGRASGPTSTALFVILYHQIKDSALLH